MRTNRSAWPGARKPGPLRAAVSIAAYDARRSARDMIVLYIIASPLLLALIARFVLPLLAPPPMTVYLAPDVPVQVAVLLGEAGHGIAASPDTADLLLAADPGTPAGLLATVAAGRDDAADLLRAALAGEFRHTRPALADTVAAFLMLSAAFLAALGSGLSIVEERSAGVDRALAVSPVGVGTYFAGKLLFIATVSIAVSLGASLLLYGLDAPFGKLTLAALAAAPLGLAAALALGLMAGSMIAAMGSIKLIMPLFLTVPLVYVIVPSGARAWFLAFPNVWMLELYRATFAGAKHSGYLVPLAATAVLGGALLIPLSTIARKKLGLKL